MTRCVRKISCNATKVAIKIMSDDTLRYAYGNEELHFEFSLLCEVGEPWQAYFADLIREFNLVLGPMKELDQRPYYADTVESISEYPHRSCN